jgi:hypothetical protein
MRTTHNRLQICLIASVLLVVLGIGNCWAMDTVVLTNGRVIHGAIISMDSISVIIAPWEDRNVLFPRGDVYAKDEIQAITFDGRVPVFPTAPGEKSLHIRTGVWELSIAASYRSADPDEGENTSFLNVPLRAGYFLARNISGEVEFMVSQEKGEDMGYTMSASVLLHPRLRFLSSRLWLRPFVLFGMGFGTAVPQGGNVPSGEEDPLNLIQGGIGVKVGDGRVGLRVEYRAASLFGSQEIYREGYDEEGNYYAYRDDESQSHVYHTIMVGFSVFLGR